MKKGWENKQLGIAAEVVAGQSPVSKFYNKSGEGLPFYQGKKQFSERYIADPDTWTTKVTKKALKGDILMSVRAPVGPVNFSTQEICIGRGLAAIRVNSELNKDYLFYFLLKHESEIVGNSGAVFNSINKKQIEQIPIPSPPLSEQEEIVEVLDKAFAAIDQAKANIEQNIANAKELFQSKLNQIFSQKGDGWVEKTLGDVIELISGQHIDSKNYNTESRGIGYLTGPSDFTELHPKVTKWTEHPKRTAINNDILITVKGSGVGSINLMEAEELCISRQLMAMRSPTVETNYLYAFLSIQYDHFQSLANGAAIPGISRQDVLNLSICIPPSEDQPRVTSKIDELRELLSLTKTHYQTKLASLDELKKSILQKAFAGELT